MGTERNAKKDGELVETVCKPLRIEIDRLDIPKNSVVRLKEDGKPERKKTIHRISRITTRKMEKKMEEENTSQEEEPDLLTEIKNFIKQPHKQVDTPSRSSKRLKNRKVKFDVLRLLSGEDSSDVSEVKRHKMSKIRELKKDDVVSEDMHLEDSDSEKLDKSEEKAKAKLKSTLQKKKRSLDQNQETQLDENPEKQIDTLDTTKPSDKDLRTSSPLDLIPELDGMNSGEKFKSCKNEHAEEMSNSHKISLRLEEKQKKQVVNISLPPPNIDPTNQTKHSSLHLALGPDILVKRVKSKKPIDTVANTRLENTPPSEDNLEGTSSSPNKLKKNKLEKLIAKTDNLETEVVVIFKQTGKNNQLQLTDAKKRKQRRVLFAKKDGSENVNQSSNLPARDSPEEDEDDRISKSEEKLPSKKISEQVLDKRNLDTHFSEKYENSFDRYFYTEDNLCEFTDSLDSDSSDEDNVLLHFICLDKDKNQKQSQPTNQDDEVTIYDLMQELSKEMPSWNIHTLSDNGHFSLVQIDNGPLGLPVMKKVILFDNDFNAQVYIGEKPILGYSGIYDSYDSIKQLVLSVDQI